MFRLLFVFAICSIKSKSLSHLPQDRREQQGEQRRTQCLLFILALDGRRLLSVDEKGLLAERVNQNHAAAAVVSVGWQASVVLLQMHRHMKRDSTGIVKTVVDAVTHELHVWVLQ